MVNKQAIDDGRQKKTIVFASGVVVKRVGDIQGALRDLDSLLVRVWHCGLLVVEISYLCEQKKTVTETKRSSPSRWLEYLDPAPKYTW